MGAQGKGLTRPQGDKGVCVVLGSGGIKPLTAISLFDHLNDHNVDVTSIFACSGGSIVGACYAAGFTTDEILEAIQRELKPSLFRLFDYRGILAALGVSFFKDDVIRGLYRGQPLLDLFRRLYGDRTFDDLDIPLALQVTDFDTGKGYQITSGPVFEAVYASCSIYPFLPPLMRDGQALVDGIFSSAVPVLDAAREVQAPIIAVNFETSKVNRAEAGLLRRSYGLISRSTHQKDQYQNAVALNAFANEIFFATFSFERRVMVWDNDFPEQIKNRAHENLERIKPQLDRFLSEVGAINTE